MEARELARIARVGLDAITGPLRNEPRRDDHAVDPQLGQVAIETEAGRSRLVAAVHVRPAPQHAHDRLLVVG